MLLFWFCKLWSIHLSYIDSMVTIPFCTVLYNWLPFSTSFIMNNHHFAAWLRKSLLAGCILQTSNRFDIIRLMDSIKHSDLDQKSPPTAILHHLQCRVDHTSVDRTNSNSTFKIHLADHEVEVTWTPAIRPCIARSKRLTVGFQDFTFHRGKLAP